MKKLFITIILVATLTPQIALAHPGNTASDGCHYCRTNCDRWGVAWNQRHCHGGSTIKQTPTYNNYSLPKTYAPPKEYNAYSPNNEQSSNEDSTWMWIGIIGVGGFLYLKYRDE